MQIETGQKLAFFYGTQVPVEFSAETAFPAGVYTFAVKQHRDPAEAAIALSTVTLAEAATTLSTVLDFGTEKALAVSQTGDLETWLEISTAGKVIFQQESELLPRVYDGSTPAPTPVTLYYTKAEVDALIAGISGAVESVNGKTGEVVLDAADVGALPAPSGGSTGDVLTKTADGETWATLPAPPVTSVNGKIGDVTLTAADLDALTTSGRAIEAIPVIGGILDIEPTEAKCYTSTAEDGELILFSSAPAGRATVTWLLLTVPTGAPSFEFGIAPWWADDEGKFAAANPAPTFDAGVYLLTFINDGTRFLANVAYSREA